MLKLSSTSALVLLWAKQKCYKSKSANHYLSQLDLTEGKYLYDQCGEVCSFYDEVIINRKYAILNILKNSFANESDILQLIIAGAGFDALGIEVKELYPHVTIFEIDVENMNTKSHLLIEPGSKSKNNIKFITANILDIPNFIKNLIDHEWNPKIPTLLVLEGISYYVLPKSIQNIIHAINPKLVIFEFLKHNNEISIDRLHIPSKVFGLISSLCKLSPITKYNYTQIGKLFNSISVIEKYSMKILEQMRTGSNKNFMTEDSGWIEVCLLANKLTDEIHTET